MAALDALSMVAPVLQSSLSCAARVLKLDPQAAVWPGHVLQLVPPHRAPVRGAQASNVGRCLG